MNKSSQSEGYLKNATDVSAPMTKNSFAHSKNVKSGGEPIAPRLGVDYPFPPHLEYAYPPPCGNVLTNIVNALVAVPHFYTQVLHLMNKMNLPAPFRMALPTPPLPPSVLAPPPPPPSVTLKPQLANLLGEESELESSEEDVDDGHARKRVKREVIVGPVVDKGVEHEAVGLKSAALVPKEVPVIKKKNTILQIKINRKPAQKEISEDDSMIREPTMPTNEEKTYLTPEEIGRGKMPVEEILSLPMFKNYATGKPATVLYIKNLAKDVVVDDLYFIFG